MNNCFKIRKREIIHNGLYGNKQHFTSFDIITEISSAVWDGVLSSDWIIVQNGVLKIPVESSDVDYHAEFIGEDIPLMLLTEILLPDIDIKDLSDRLGVILLKEISKTFDMPCNLPITYN